MMQAPDPEIDGLDCSDLYARLDQTRANATNGREKDANINGENMVSFSDV